MTPDRATSTVGLREARESVDRSVAQPRTGSRWTRIGIGGGGAMFLPTVSPHDQNTVVVTCDMTGCYLTHDAGGSWRNFNLRGEAYDVSFDPHGERTVYVAAGSAGLWRSADHGESWECLYPDPDRIADIVCPDDHAGTEYVLTDGRRSGAVTALAVDGRTAGTLYLGEQTDDGTILHGSTDGGRSWRQLASLPGESVRGLHVGPSTGGMSQTAGSPVLWLVTDTAVHEYADGTLHRLPGPAEGEALASHAFGHSGEETRWYWATTTSLYVSTDRGRTWTESRLPGNPGRGYGLHAMAVCATDPRVAYVSYAGLRAERGDDRAGDTDGTEHFGIARTDDGGSTWTLVSASTPDHQDNTDDDWVSQTPARSEWAWGVGVGPHDPNLCYVTDWGSVWRTTDGGRRWNQAYFRRVTPASVTTTGLDVTTNYGVFHDPFDSSRQFIAYTDVGLIRSEDGGRSWQPTQEGIPERWHNTTYWMVFDPEERGRVWAVMAYDHDMPRPKMWRHKSTDAYQGGVCTSTDGGRTWQVSCDGMPPTAPTNIVLDPRSPVGSRTLYVTAMGRGVFRSVDGGASWQPVVDGIEEDRPLAWQLCLSGDGSFYLVVFRRGEHGRDQGGDGALYRSTDGADHWERVALPDGVNGPAGILADPADPGRLYLSAWRRESSDAKAGGGIYLSTDRGASWRQVLDRDQHVYDVTADPRHPGHLYAAGFESNAWRSTDHGETWERIQGFNFKWAHRVVPDPLDPESIYVTTFGGGVWHGPADGDPDAAEDIRTPRLAYHRRPAN
ncbi:WD40/YVTN/BNR-like repeat-containing protein [Actinopolymorpha rutila]|nr:exo-alpha-sialidase [Actinopolymorpha rutila]